MAKDILGYPPTKQEQEILALIRKTEYGEVAVKIQAGRVVLIEEKRTTKIEK